MEDLRRWMMSNEEVSCGWWMVDGKGLGRMMCRKQE